MHVWVVVCSHSLLAIPLGKEERICLLRAKVVFGHSSKVLVASIVHSYNVVGNASSRVGLSVVNLFHLFQSLELRRVFVLFWTLFNMLSHSCNSEVGLRLCKLRVRVSVLLSLALGDG